MELDERGPAIRAGVVAVALLEALRVSPPHLVRGVPGARKSPDELIAPLVETTPGRAVRIDRMAARKRKEHEVLVVSGGRSRPAKRRIRMLAAQADVKARAVSARPLSVHRNATAVVGEGLSRPRGRKPARVRLDLALRPTPRAPGREDDVDRIDAVGRARRTGVVRVPIGRVELGKRGCTDERRSRRDHHDEGETMHVSSVGAVSAPACANFVPKSSHPQSKPIARSAALGTVRPVQDFDVAATAARLAERGGGYESVHTSPGLEIGVYVLVAPEDDKQAPHAFDEAYVVLNGEGEIEIEGERRPIRRGEGVFVTAGAEHRIHAYDELTLLVVFNGSHSLSPAQ